MDISVEAPAEPPVLVATLRMPFPLSRVWTAVTEPLYIQEWFAPHGYTNRSVEMDVSPGGAWRMSQMDPEGNAFAFYGRFDIVERESRLRFSQTSEIFPDVTTWLRVEMAGSPAGTMMVVSHLFPSDYHRTAYLNLGGLARLREPLERLDTLLRSMS
ncbi:SRPBCC family protein [Demequina mangrovi]|uniref:Activator of Hsp90 ATPase homolog 1-like protein n=1 Tax=Demequina mangrovi TaxID=1043493 RepID=A0A1H7ARR7_9MICO|nr:SRPBCC domain-containing protein [Demequina mangrovi]SEJ66567.1 Activator of Hsp90 ATPase homolog 1-like protein [Demequina mangrovi]